MTVVVGSCAGTERLGLTDRAADAVAAPLLEAAADGSVAVLAPGALTALGGRSESDDRAFAIAVLIERPTPALLVVAGPARLAQSLQPSLQALAAEVALALESVTLTAEVHRRQGEARLGSLVRHASDLITVVARDGTVTYQSPSIERLLGYTPDEVTGRRFDDLVAASDRTRLQEVLAEDAVRPEPPAGDRVHAAPPRRQRPPLRDPAHQPAQRRARRRDRPQLPRRERAARLRGAADPPGVPRSRHEARQPRAVRRARPPRARARAPRGSRHRRRLHGPRRLQDGQRQPRPRRRRRGPGRGRQATRGEHPRRATPLPASAATSSRCCSRTARTFRRRPTSPTACSRRSRCR